MMILNAGRMHYIFMQFFKRHFMLLVLSCSLFVSACAQQQHIDPSSHALTPETLEKPEQVSTETSGDSVTHSANTKVKYASFKPETLYNLMLAEFALYREMPALSLNAYHQQAHQTRDPGVIRRAVEISLYLEADETSLDLLQLWQEVEPQNPDVYRLLARQQIILGDLLSSVKAIEKVLELHAGFDFELFNQVLRNVTKKDYPALDLELTRLSKRFPEDSQLWLTHSRLHSLQGNQEEALAASQKAIRLDEKNVVPVLVHAEQMFNFSDDPEKKDALRYMEKHLKKFPENRALNLLYLNSLLILSNQDKSARQLHKMLQQFSGDDELRFRSALLVMDAQMYTLAKQYFQESLESRYRVDESNFYLARIAEGENDIQTALEYLQAINSGPGFVAARLQIAYLLDSQGETGKAIASLQRAKEIQAQDSETFFQVEANLLVDSGQLEKALGVFNQALMAYPDSTKLLYSRALLADRLDRLDILEKDLLKVINLEPKNAAALNALGYTLTNKTTRHKEAFNYISRALELTPNDPAVIDSMGWVYYRMGNNQEAIKYLQQANSMLSDHEIAAHLGEVLWAEGLYEEAKKVWNEAIGKYKESPILKEVMERFLGN